jgi:hypothetical protein
MKWPTSDVVNPILVKELRQGVRSKLFLSSFFAVQGLLFVYGMSLLMNQGLREANVGAWLFWAALSLPLLLQVPSMAGQSIEKEMSGKTLELLLVTPLSSMRLLIGKWLSVILQAALLATTALPYVMLRYVLGGVDLWSELAAVALLVSASAILAGMALGTSGVSKLAKAFVLIVAVSAILLLLAAHRGLGAPSAHLGVLLLAYGFLLMLLMLLMGARRIGPPAENHVTRLRAVAFASLLGPIFFHAAAREVEAIATCFTVLILLFASITALTEPLLPIPRLYTPFARTSGLKRFVLMPFAPGWPGGVAYTVLVSLLIPLLPVWIDDIKPLVLLASMATLLFPAAILRGLVPKKRQTLGVYVLLLVLSSAPLFVLVAAKAFDNGWTVLAIQGLAGFMPPVALVLVYQLASDFSIALAGVELVVVLVLSLLVLTRVGRREWAAVTRSAPSEPARRASSLVLGLPS